MCNFNVSVIVATYNPILRKLINTLKSILMQKDLEIEIIVADDCSEENFFHEIEELFIEYEFNDYVLLDSNVNVGTCKNISRAVQIVKGEFVKLISPGDYLYNDWILYNWYNYMKERNSVISFSKAIYYYYNDNALIIYKRTTQPSFPRMYGKSNTAIQKYSFLFKQFILGAATLVKTETAKKYLSIIVKGGVKYAEDYMYQLMIFDDIIPTYYQEVSIWYEYGTGISSSNSKWSSLLQKDLYLLEDIIKKDFLGNSFWGKRCKLYCKMKCSGIQKRKLRFLITCLIFPECIFMKMEKDKHIEYTQTDVSISDYNQIVGEQYAVQEYTVVQI